MIVNKLVRCQKFGTLRYNAKFGPIEVLVLNFVA